MAKDKILVIRGELNWAKLVGPARPYTGNPKYDKGPYWSVDLTPDAEGRAALAALGLDKGGKKGTGKFRTPGENDPRKETFLTLTVLETKKDGTKNAPPKVVDAANQKWDGSLIGNGSIGDVKVKYVDYGDPDTAGLYFQALRVLDHVPYESSDFEELDEEDEYFAGGAAAKDAKTTGAPATGDEDLDDDVPF